MDLHSATFPRVSTVILHPHSRVPPYAPYDRSLGRCLVAVTDRMHLQPEAPTPPHAKRKYSYIQIIS